MGEAPSDMTSHGSAATTMSVWDKSFQEHGVPHHHFKIAPCSIPGRIFLHLPMQVLAGFIAGFCLGVKIVGINLWGHQHLQTLLRDSACIALFAEVGVCQQRLCMFDAHTCDAKGMGFSPSSSTHKHFGKSRLWCPLLCCHQCSLDRSSGCHNY